MKKKNSWQAIAAIICCAAIIACGDDSNNSGTDTGNGSGETVSKYIVIASSDKGSYLLNASNLNVDDLTIVNNGYEAETATSWVFYADKYAYRLVYNQGNSGTGSSYYIDANGDVKERNIAFEITNRFTTYGTYGKYVITAASGEMLGYEVSGENPNNPYGITFTYIDTETQKLNTKSVVTENMVDNNGEYYTMSGIVEVGDKLFTALCPQGYSAYGVWEGHEDLNEALANYPDLVSETGTVSTTIHPNKVWVAIYDNVNFENPKIISDNRLSFATSRRQSQFYSTIATDANNNIYVFSASNAKGYDPPHQTTKNSGVIRINAGTEAFDTDYYFDIEEASEGRHLYRVNHISEDYFLLRMYSNAGETTANTSATKKMAIFKAESGTFRWVTGLPEEAVVSDYGLFVYAEGGLIYVPTVTTDGAQPAIYIIDPTTATAKKGITVTSNSITAIGKLTYYE